MKKVGLFPGSFDPFTKGHEAVVNKSLTLFDEVIIGVGINRTKQYMYDIEKRMTHIQSLFSHEPKIKIQQYTNLTVTFCKEIGANFIIRGLRDSKDFQYEKSIAHMNFAISEIETVFFLTTQKYSAINATIIREIARNGGPIDAFVTNADLLV
jgi:pantetheine-phosphate adenylyltransferase